jgi:hypothetical protein
VHEAQEKKRGRAVIVRQTHTRAFCKAALGSMCGHSFGVQFRVQAALGEVCMHMTTERGSLLHPLLAGPASQPLEPHVSLLVTPALCCLAPWPAAACRPALFNICVVCAHAKLPCCMVPAVLLLWPTILTSCSADQAACLFVRGAHAHICMCHLLLP